MILKLIQYQTKKESEKGFPEVLHIDDVNEMRLQENKSIEQLAHYFNDDYRYFGGYDKEGGDVIARGLTITNSKGEIHNWIVEIGTNIYLMNNEGKTIERVT